MTLTPINDIQQMFPLEEDFVDYSGNSRRFRISLHKLVAEDFSLSATDLSQTEGYHFEVYSAVYSKSALGLALGRLRWKIRKGVSTRYLHINAKGKKQLTHDEIRGRISYNGIVVDGSLLNFRDFAEILTTHEGFQISIKIGEPAE